MTVQATSWRATDERGELARRLALGVGVTFLVVGVFGFVPGITTNYGEMTFAGPNSEAQLLGLSNVSVLHNVVHLAFGVAGIVMAGERLRLSPSSSAVA